MPQPDLDVLRQMLARRQQENAELELEVGAFESQLWGELAPLHEEVLRRRMEQLKGAAQTHQRNARLRNAYHDARDAYEDFRSKGPDARECFSESGMKTAFRRASKECHPDAVPERYRTEAAATFRALESAYEGEHGPALRAIAESLDQWGFPGRRETPSVDRIREAVESLGASIARLRDSDSHRLVSQAGDLDAAIDARKGELVQRLRELRRGRRGRSRRR